MSERNQRGTEAELAGLHGLLSQYFSARLNSGEALTSSELNVIVGVNEHDLHQAIRCIYDVAVRRTYDVFITSSLV